jgi:hypothetical protein
MLAVLALGWQGVSGRAVADWPRALVPRTHTRHTQTPRQPRRKLDSFELSFFNNSRTVELVHSFLQKGALHDMSFLQVRALWARNRDR